MSQNQREDEVDTDTRGEITERRCAVREGGEEFTLSPSPKTMSQNENDRRRQGRQERAAGFSARRRWRGMGRREHTGSSREWHTG